MTRIALIPIPLAAMCACLILASARAAPSLENPPFATSAPASAVVAVADEDVFVSGADADLDHVVTGDAFAAGGRVRLRGEVKGDAVLAGTDVSVEDRVGGDLYAAGGAVRVAASVDRNARLAGGKVSVGPRGVIFGRATIAGGEVDVAGRVDGTVSLYADSVRVDGDVGGDLRITARTIHIGPAAQIGGRLIYRSGAPADISPSAVIAGGMEYIRGEEGECGLEPVARAAGWVATGMTFVSLLALGAILLLLFPGFSAAAARTLTSDPGKSIALGFALSLCVPSAAIVALVTVIGIPLGLALLLLYPVLLLLGAVTVSVAMGDRLAARMRKQREGSPRGAARLLGLAISLAVLVLAARIPNVGWFVLLLAVIAGLGACSLRCWRVYTAPGEQVGS